MSDLLAPKIPPNLTCDQQSSDHTEVLHPLFPVCLTVVKNCVNFAKFVLQSSPGENRNFLNIGEGFKEGFFVNGPGRSSYKIRIVLDQEIIEIYNTIKINYI